jgi:hypothetical protein
LATAKTLHFDRFFPHTGKRAVVVEIWQDENGEYHYVEGQQPAATNSGVRGLLPSRYRDWFTRKSQNTNN